MISRLIREDVDVRIISEPHAYLVKVDPGQLEQIIMNLASNARDAMPDGGRLTIETANARIDDVHQRQHPDIALEPDHTPCSLSPIPRVGIDPDTQIHIFEPFLTTKPRGQVTGLGLSTVYGIVKQSGWHLWVDSKPDRGTTFKVYLPKTEEAQITPVAARKLQVGHRIRIDTCRGRPAHAARPHLHNVGGHCYTVLSVGRPTQALSLARFHTGPIRLVLTDVIMPEMNGRDIIEP
jgi:two-component system, cell cycle sensor histidine kinase and response regulator CckA